MKSDQNDLAAVPAPRGAGGNLQPFKKVSSMRSVNNAVLSPSSNANQSMRESGVAPSIAPRLPETPISIFRAGSAKPSMAEVGERFLALFRQYESNSRRYWKAMSLLDKATNAACPAEIIMRADDALLFDRAGITLDPVEDNKVGKALLPTTIGQLEEEADLGSMTRAMRARRHELIAARDEWERAIERAGRTLGIDRIDQDGNELAAELDALAKTAIHLKAKTSADFHAKATMACWMSDYRDLDKTTAAPVDKRSAIAWSIARDLLEQSQLDADEQSRIRAACA